MKVIRQGVYFMEGRLIKESQAFMTSDKKESARSHTMVHAVSEAHGASFDLFATDRSIHENLFRTADAIGGSLSFPRHILFADRGDAFSRAAAKKFGGTVVYGGASPTSYLAECEAATGTCALVSFPCALGALGAVAIMGDEGDLLRAATDRRVPDLTPFAVFVKGKPPKGVGPVDVALALLQALQTGRYSEGKVLEFFGPGLDSLSVEFRLGVDRALAGKVFSTLWQTDARTLEYLAAHGREGMPLAPAQPAYYEGGVVLNLTETEPMANFFGEIVPLRVLQESEAAETYCREGGIRGGVIRDADFETMAEVAEILRGKSVRFPLAIEPASGAALRAASEAGYLVALIDAGVCANVREPALLNCENIVLDARTIAASALCGRLAAAGGTGVRRLKKAVRCGDCYRAFREEFAGDGAPLGYPEGTSPLAEFPPLPDDLLLTVVIQEEGEHAPKAFCLGRSENGGTMSAKYAVCRRSAEGAPWGEAIAMREQSVVAVLAKTYSEKTRRHLCDWGILPLSCDTALAAGNVLALEHVRGAVERGEPCLSARLTRGKKEKTVVLRLGALGDRERLALLAGSRVALLARGNVGSDAK